MVRTQRSIRIEIAQITNSTSLNGTNRAEHGFAAGPDTLTIVNLLNVEGAWTMTHTASDKTTPRIRRNLVTELRSGSLVIGMLWVLEHYCPVMNLEGPQNQKFVARTDSHHPKAEFQTGRK